MQCETAFGAVTNLHKYQFLEGHSSCFQTPAFSSHSTSPSLKLVQDSETTSSWNSWCSAFCVRRKVRVKEAESWQSSAAVCNDSACFMLGDNKYVWHPKKSMFKGSWIQIYQLKYRNICPKTWWNTAIVSTTSYGNWWSWLVMWSLIGFHI